MLHDLQARPPITPLTNILSPQAREVIPCPLCKTTGNKLVIKERCIERRFDMPVLPVPDYIQANCRNCGLLYINAPIDQGYLNSLYLNETVDWAAEVLGSPDARMNDDERARFAEVVRHVARFTKLDGAQWLDFGCQTGELGEAAMKRGAVMSGVEISPDYAKRAAKLWGRDPSAVQSFITGHDGKQFDIITSLETLEHMAEPWKQVAEFRKYLKPGGLLVVSVPSSHYFRLKYHAFKMARRGRERAAESPSLYGLCHTHLYNFTPKSLALMVDAQGFKTEVVGGIGWLSGRAAAEKAALLLEALTINRIAVFPSVLAVARLA